MRNKAVWILLPTISWETTATEIQKQHASDSTERLDVEAKNARKIDIVKSRQDAVAFLLISTKPGCCSNFTVKNFNQADW